MKTDFPTKKTFVQDFINEKLKNLFTIRYEQATMGEYYEYMQKSTEEQNIELSEILQKSIPYSLKDKILKRIYPEYLTKIEMGLDIENIVKNIFENRYRVYKSIFDGIKDSRKKGGRSIESVGLSSICKEYNLSPTDLMKNYTLEQYFWFLDGIAWKGNSMTDEGKLINTMASADRDSIKERAQHTRDMFKKFKK